MRLRSLKDSDHVRPGHTPSSIAGAEEPGGRPRTGEGVAAIGRADVAIRVALYVITLLTVAGLAAVAGAISFSHMSTLALAHGQPGWKSTAFPISMDGLELVSSFYILAQHRAERRTGPLPWTALLVGTAASLAANIAVGGHDPIGRALAGWPAVSLLVSIKLLFSMFDPDTGNRRTVRDDQRTVPDGPAVSGTVHGTSQLDERVDRTTSTPGTEIPRKPASNTRPEAGTGLSVSSVGPAPTAVALLDVRDVAELLPAARDARAAGSQRAVAVARQADRADA
jgi:hypothetical protein